MTRPVFVDPALNAVVMEIELVVRNALIRYAQRPILYILQVNEIFRLMGLFSKTSMSILYALKEDSI